MIAIATKNQMDKTVLLKVNSNASVQINVLSDYNNGSMRNEDNLI